MGGGCCIGNNPVVDWFRDRIDDIKDFFSTDSSSSSYSASSVSSNSSTSRVTKVANELAEIREDMNSRAEKIEEKVMKYVTRNYVSLIRDIEQINDRDFNGVKYRVNTEKIISLNDSLENEVKGTISQEVNAKLVQGNPEIDEILDEEDDDTRNMDLNNYCQRVLRDAKIPFSEAVKKTVKAQSEVVTDEIGKRLNEIKSQVKNEEERYNALYSDFRSKQGESQKIKEQTVLEYNIYDIILRELGA